MIEVVHLDSANGGPDDDSIKALHNDNSGPSPNTLGTTLSSGLQLTGVLNRSSIDSLGNSGDIGGSEKAIYNFLNVSTDGYIGGAIVGTQGYGSAAIANSGNIGFANYYEPGSGNKNGTSATGIYNTGYISAPSKGIWNLTGGLITGSDHAILNSSGSIGFDPTTLLFAQVGIYNDGTISSANGSAIENSGTGTIFGDSTSILNAGTISGFNHAILNQATIGYTTFDGNNDSIVEDHFSSYGISNSSSIVSLNRSAIQNNGFIYGSSFAINNTSNISGVTQGILNEGSILSSSIAIGNYGTILSSVGSAIQNSNTIGGSFKSIDNTGSVSGVSYGILNQGNIGYANGDTSTAGIFNANGGTIEASDGVGIQNATGANIFGSSQLVSYWGSIENWGSISGSAHAISNDGSIGYIIGNTGSMTGEIGIQNAGSISSSNGAGIQNTSNGSIFGTQQGIFNHASSTISGQTFAISNDGVIGSAGGYFSQDGIRNEGTLSSVNRTAIYNSSSGIITGGTGIFNTFGATIQGDIQNAGTIKSIINQGQISGNIVNSGYIDTINISNGTFTGEVRNSRHIEELYLGNHTLSLTGNNASLGPGVNYTNGASVNIGIDQNTTANFTSTASGQFAKPLPDLLSNFNINAGSTFNSFTGISDIHSEKFTNSGTLSIKAGDQLNLYMGASGPTDKYSQSGHIEIGINNASSGQLVIRGDAALNGTIGIQSGSIVNEGTYSSVIKINPTSGFVNDKTLLAATPYYISNRRKYSYEAILNTSDTMFPVSFDLLLRDIGPAGPATSDTQSAIKNTVARLRGTFNAASVASGYANMNTYDCNLFDKNNMCISAGGRYNSIDNPNNHSTSAVVVLGYKFSPQIRIGGFLDQSLNNTAPQGLHVSNKNPLMGAFAVWNASQDGLGFQIKLANTYQDKDVSTMRDVIGTSEAGRGNTSLNIQSYVAELSYAFRYQDRTIVRPYFAMRHTKIKQDAYVEEGVDTPLAYDAIKNRATTSLTGLKLNHALTPALNLTMSLGLEHDLNYDAGQYIARSSIIENLQPENLSDRINKNRAVASLGAYLAINKTQRLSADFYYQELASQSGGSKTAYVNYMIGF